MELTNAQSDYTLLVERISDTFGHAQIRAAQAVNSVLINTYWQVGQHIVEFEQAGQQRATYGKALLEALARDLTLRHGRGFSRSNLNYMRLFYQRYPICEKASHKLSWSHYVELLKIDDELERSFYEKQAIAERWSVPDGRPVMHKKNRRCRIRQLAKQYVTPLPMLTKDLSTLSARGNDRLRKMGAVWK
jgi:predicted nuclease of restriction endonuclease-like (RecB) superfamily